MFDAKCPSSQYCFGRFKESAAKGRPAGARRDSQKQSRLMRGRSAATAIKHSQIHKDRDGAPRAHAAVATSLPKLPNNDARVLYIIAPLYQ